MMLGSDRYNRPTETVSIVSLRYRLFLTNRKRCALGLDCQRAYLMSIPLILRIN